MEQCGGHHRSLGNIAIINTKIRTDANNSEIYTLRRELYIQKHSWGEIRKRISSKKLRVKLPQAEDISGAVF